MKGVRITVVKTEYYPELAREVDLTKQKGGAFTPCPIFRKGQEFIIHNIDEIPNGFCSWAWADIERDAAMILFGGCPQPTLKKPHSMYSCCDEGLRPVIFKLEQIEVPS